MSREPLRPRAAYRAFRTIPTRWADNDVYGHVNNVVFYAWFDTAVNAHLIEQGALDIHAGEVIGLVVETGCRYARPVAFPETVEAGIRVGRLGTSGVRHEVGLVPARAAEPAAHVGGEVVLCGGREAAHVGEQRRAGRLGR